MLVSRRAQKSISLVIEIQVVSRYDLTCQDFFPSLFLLLKYFFVIFQKAIWAGDSTDVKMSSQTIHIWNIWLITASCCRKFCPNINWLTLVLDLKITSFKEATTTNHVSYYKHIIVPWCHRRLREMTIISI